MSTSTLHVIPENDLLGHEWLDCWCGPTPKREVRDDGTDAGWLMIHHSADGREKREKARQDG